MPPAIRPRPPVSALEIVETFNAGIRRVFATADRLGFIDTLRGHLRRFVTRSETHRIVFQGAGPGLDGALLGQRVLGNLSRLPSGTPLATLARTLHDYLAFASSKSAGRIAISGGERSEDSVAEMLQFLAAHAADAELRPSERPTVSPPADAPVDAPLEELASAQAEVPVERTCVVENASSRRMAAARPPPPRPPRAPPPTRPSASSHTKLIASRTESVESVDEGRTEARVPAPAPEPAGPVAPPEPPVLVFRSVAPPPLPAPELAAPIASIATTETPEEVPSAPRRSSSARLVVPLVILGACTIAILGVRNYLQRSPTRELRGTPGDESTPSLRETSAVTTKSEVPASAAPEAAKASPLPPSTVGSVSVTDENARGHRVIVDGRAIGDAPKRLELSCGLHSIRIGSKGSLQDVDVPCGGEVSVRPRWASH